MQDIKDVFLAAAPSDPLGRGGPEEFCQQPQGENSGDCPALDGNRELLETLPPAEYMADLRRVWVLARPWQVGIDGELVQRAILYAKEVRHRYTILQLLWDLDLLADYALRQAPGKGVMVHEREVARHC